MSVNVNILISGVGGQGTLLASRIIGNVAIEAGYDVKVSEVHGMSQRGGSVVTFVKFSDGKVSSPILNEGEADYVLAFEALEAYRSLPFLKKDGLLLYNTQKINPMPVITGAEKYPEEISEKINSLGINNVSVDALALAKEAGSERSVNLALIGLLSPSLPFPKENWLEAIKRTTKEKFVDINLKAFELGLSNAK